MTVMVWDKIRTPHMIKAGFVPIVALGKEPIVHLIPLLKQIKFSWWSEDGQVLVYTVDRPLWNWALLQQPGCN